MAQDLDTEDPRAAAWEARLRMPVLVAAFAVLPLIALSLAHPRGLWHSVEVMGHWAVWLAFAVEVVVMLSVVKDRRAWIGGHRFELLVVVAASPLVSLALALAPALRSLPSRSAMHPTVAVATPLLPLALTAAPALRLLIVAKAFKTLKLVKAIKLAKLAKSVRLLRRKLVLEGAAEFALGAVAIALAALTVGYMLTGDAPLKGNARTVALVAAGMLATFGVNHLRIRTARAAREL